MYASFLCVAYPCMPRIICFDRIYAKNHMLSTLYMLQDASKKAMDV